MKKTGFTILLGLILITILFKRVKSDKLVIDTDAGADDAMAILLAISITADKDTNFEIVAITCTYGNTNLTNVESNVLKTLTIAKEALQWRKKPRYIMCIPKFERCDLMIPVYSGASKPLIGNHTSDNFFGNDGFGDFKFDQKINGNINRSKHAAIALIDLANKYPGELSILILGPTTNVALAILFDPTFVNKVKQFYVIGGSVRGIGNIRPGVEFNFGADPESNFILFNSTKGKVSLLLPWDTISSTNITLLWRKNTLGEVGSNIIKFLNKAESKMIEFPHWAGSDPLIVAAMLNPKPKFSNYTLHRPYISNQNSTFSSRILIVVLKKKLLFNTI